MMNNLVNASIRATLQRATNFLHNSSTPRLDAQLLLMHVLQVSKTYLFANPEKLLTQQNIDTFQFLLKRRQQGEPVAYIVGYKEFWSLDFMVDNRVLIPRPETELLIELAMDLLQDVVEPMIADLGTGSGAIAISITKSLSNSFCAAVDNSREAIQVAIRNAKHLDVNNIEFICGDFFKALAKSHAQQFDLIVSNPPYIADDDQHLEQGDIRFEPISALTSGADGLDSIKTIVSQAHKFLKSGGFLLLEHGYDQADAITELMRKHNYINIRTEQDLAGLDRVTLGSRSHDV
jgi:release factor glutamine methyltransferase